MIIIVEGIDRIGKTTLCKKVSELYNYSYVERPMRRVLNITDKQYDDLCNYIWSKDNKNVVLSFFILGNLLTRYYGENIVADRHILSSYYWDSNEQNEEIFDYFYRGDVVPDLTLILYASQEVRRNRIIKRNANDPDINELANNSSGYDKMIKFAKRIDMPYIIVNTENMSENEVFEYCTEILSKFLNEDTTTKKELCDYYNNLFIENNNVNTKKLCLTC